MCSNLFLLSFFLLVVTFSTIPSKGTQIKRHKRMDNRQGEKTVAGYHLRQRKPNKSELDDQAKQREHLSEAKAAGSQKEVVHQKRKGKANPTKKAKTKQKTPTDDQKSVEEAAALKRVSSDPMETNDQHQPNAAADQPYQLGSGSAPLFGVSQNAIQEMLLDNTTRHASAAAAAALAHHSVVSPSPQIGTHSGKEEETQPMDIEGENLDDEFGLANLEFEPDIVEEMIADANSGFSEDTLLNLLKVCNSAKIRKSRPLTAYFMAVQMTLLSIIYHISGLNVEMVDALDDTATVGSLIQQNVGNRVGCALLKHEEKLADELIGNFIVLNGKVDNVAGKLADECAKIRTKLDKNGTEAPLWKELNEKLWNLQFYAWLYGVLRTLLWQLHAEIEDSLKVYVVKLLEFVEHVFTVLNALLGRAEQSAAEERTKADIVRFNGTTVAEQIVAELRVNVCGEAAVGQRQAEDEKATK